MLLQNNRELRATGGFVGSYARISTKSFEIEDIYVPDGQLVGHVEPPYPIQEAFRQGWWKLRDSNWDIDYASSAATMKWFFEQGGEKDVKGIIAVNLSLVDKIFDILGPVLVLDYRVEVNGQNLYALTQEKAETGSFAGSSQKRDFIRALSSTMMRKLNFVNVVKLVWLGVQELEKGQIYIWMHDQRLENSVERLGWSGGLGQVGNNDYLYIVESNLGANKANCCIEREVVQDWGKKLTITWKNTGEFSDPRPPKFWGGDYWDYVRIVIPVNHKIQAIKIQNRELRLATKEDFKMPNSTRQEKSLDIYNIETRGDLQIIGFWAITKAGESTVAEVEYLGGEYKKILVRRQPGIEGFQYKLIRDGKVEAIRYVDRDVWIK